MTARRFLPLIAILLSATACAADGERGETYGFIAMLGNDTTSVERITRTGNRIISDAVGRSPTVVRRHWEATLAPDGSVTRWVMETRIPNAAPGETELHHEMVVDGNTVRLVRRTGGGASDVTHAASYAVTVPWNAFVYGTYELLFDAARGRPDSTRIGQYFFEGWAEGGVGYASVRTLDSASVAISSTGLAGSGVARFNAAGRMISYSGEGTTYKQEVRRVEAVPDVDAVAQRFAEDERARGVVSSLSVRDTVQATVGAATLRVEYSRPLVRGRTLVGGLIPYGRVWRTGANAATHLTVSAPIRLADVALDTGTYTLWTLPTEQGVQLIINRQTGQWGTGYRAEHDIARVPLQVETPPSHVEVFTIHIDPAQNAAPARLVMDWGNFRWSAPIRASDSPG